MSASRDLQTKHLASEVEADAPAIGVDFPDGSHQWDSLVKTRGSNKDKLQIQEAPRKALECGGLRRFAFFFSLTKKSGGDCRTPTALAFALLSFFSPRKQSGGD